MIVIGITGGIGAGKSAVAEAFRKLGASVFDSDRIAASLLEKSGEAYPLVLGEFGERILSPSGQVDRKALADMVFRDPDKRRKLESIIHPLVVRKRRESLEKLAEGLGEKAVVVAEAALIFEAGTGGEFDKVVLVKAPLEERKRRLAERGMSPGEIDERMSAQWPDHKKEPLADYVIDNGGSIEDMAAQVEKIMSEIGAC